MEALLHSVPPTLHQATADPCLYLRLLDTQGNSRSVSCGVLDRQGPAAVAGALGAADLGRRQALLEEVAINPTVQPPELSQDTRHKQNFVQTRTQEKEQ